MKTGGIGRGWHNEIEPEPYQELGKQTLKKLLDDIFKKIAENKKEDHEK